ncbi:MAG: DNA polymerase III subunit delta [Chromatiales bacterium]|nr:DNA polymerase III subunit delta [Chromatiales bacterium]
MKLRAEQLAAHLKGTLAPLYVVSGDEPLLVQEACDAIRSAARAQGFTERTVFEVDNAFSWNAMTQSVSNLSLFAERRLIELRFDSARPGDEGSEALQHYASTTPADTLLLLSFPRLDGQAQKTKWYKALETSAMVLALWPPELAELPGWVARRMTQRGLKPGVGAAAVLAERAEGNLLACAQEIEKILLLRGPGPVEADEVLRAVADSARFDVYDLVDAALAGDGARCVRVLAGLRGEGVEPPLVAWALARAIRAHAGFADKRAQGENLDTLLRFDKIWGRRQNLIERALHRHDRAAWLAMLCQAAHLDRVAKGQAPGNAWDELLQLALTIAGLTNLLPQQSPAAMEESHGYH